MNALSSKLLEDKVTTQSPVNKVESGKLLEEIVTKVEKLIFCRTMSSIDFYKNKINWIYVIATVIAFETMNLDLAFVYAKLNSKILLQWNVFSSRQGSISLISVVKNICRSSAVCYQLHSSFSVNNVCGSYKKIMQILCPSYSIVYLLHCIQIHKSFLSIVFVEYNHRDSDLYIVWYM